ncbi:MAG TPA: hypothetical protein VF692_10890 [Pyrinomonadaceae bacterium]|jgi:pantothenate kinase
MRTYGLPQNNNVSTQNIQICQKGRLNFKQYRRLFQYINVKLSRCDLLAGRDTGLDAAINHIQNRTSATVVASN